MRNHWLLLAVHVDDLSPRISGEAFGMTPWPITERPCSTGGPFDIGAPLHLPSGGPARRTDGRPGGKCSNFCLLQQQLQSHEAVAARVKRVAARATLLDAEAMRATASI